MRGTAIVAHAAEPLAEEKLECLPLACQIPAKKRPEGSVVLDAVIEPVDQHPDPGGAADSRKEVAADERTMSLRVSQEPTMFHLLPISAHRSSKHNRRVWCRVNGQH